MKKRKQPDPEHSVEPAFSILEKCGGAVLVAQAIGYSDTAVYRWCYAHNVGGRGGEISLKGRRLILAAIAAGKLPGGAGITSADFDLPPQQSAAA